MAGETTQARRNDAVHKNISISSSGDNTIVAAVAGTIIRIYKIILMAGTATSLTAILYDGPSSTGTAKGTYFLGAIAEDLEANPIILTVGNQFVINLSSANSVVGSVSYIQENP